MKQGLPCDLTERLAGDAAFALSHEQILSALDPAAYTAANSGVVLLPDRTEFTIDNVDDYDF